MISYITAISGEHIFNKNLKPSLELFENDELIIEQDHDSISKAYNSGISKAKNKIKCFIHQDVIVIDSDKLRRNINMICSSNLVGMVGVIGTIDPYVIPWWDGKKGHVGSVIDPNFGLYNFGKEGRFCGSLDGLLLATAQDIKFDESLSGFHAYDYDICRQMIEKGLNNYCLPNGRQLVVHNSIFKPTDFSEIFNVCKKKWNIT